MKKFLTLFLAVAMLLSLCCGTAYADWTGSGSGAPAEKAEEAPAEAGEDVAQLLAAELEGDYVYEGDPEEGIAEYEESLREESEAESAEFEEIFWETPEEGESWVWDDVFADWNGDAPALAALIDYVEAVTDETGADYIPVEDRIAVFDMDGTLYGELFPTYLEYYMLAWRILKDPSITPDEEMLALGRELRESVISHSFAADMPIRHAQQAARAYAGLTMEEFADFVTGILVRDVDGFEGMTYGTAFYQPMLEVIDYLQDNAFTVYVVSGSDRAICRTLLEGVIDIPYANIIGMDVGYEATGQGDTDGLDYVFRAGDEVVRTDRLIIKNLKMNKVLQIVQDIGQKPVLSFGNSSGDVSMHMYTINGNPYRSAAFMLIADDETRDYGNEEKVQSLRKEWEDDGFQVISMKNDFRTIYGDNVVKTGSFRWAEEMADDRDAQDRSPEWVSALPQAQDATQILVAAGVGPTTATVSLHEKSADGTWRQILTTPGYIGKNGLGKEAEGDGKTPVGTFRFTSAFGIAEDPGCEIPYHRVTGDDYWSGDQREGYGYNKMVDIRDLPDLNTEDSEHLLDYTEAYQYCLNISYNEEGEPGLGSAIFLHCFKPEQPFTGGCVAIPREQMAAVMQHVKPDCVVVIDSLENLSPETYEKWGLAPNAPAETEEPVIEAEEAAEPAVEAEEAAEPAPEAEEAAEPAPEAEEAAEPAPEAEEAAEPAPEAEEAAEPAPEAEEAAEPAPEAEVAAEPAPEAEEAAEPAPEAEEAAEPAPKIWSGRSRLYTDEELTAAADLIMEEFDTWEGCEMHSLRYAGDRVCSRANLRWLNNLDGGRRFTQCAAFLSSFHSPTEGGGAWEPDVEYMGWQWWLAREDSGDWELITWGY